MAKKPCYTCGSAMKKQKRQVLLENTIKDAKESASKNKFTGIIGIYQRSNKLGFEAIEESKADGRRAVQYLSFNSGVAF